MGWVSAVVVFVLSWWLIFFMALPFGVRRTEVVDPGHDPGAPERTRLWTKVAVTTALAMAVTVLIHFAVEADLVSFRRPA